MPEVDARWLEAVEGAVAHLVEAVAAAHGLCGAGSTGLSVRRLTAALAPAPDGLHAAVLATRLLGAGRSLVLRLHAAFEQTDPTHTTTSSEPRCACNDAAWSGVGAFTTWPDDDPRLAFANWLDGVLAQFDREHPPTPAARAADLVRTDPVRPWRMDELAQRLDVSRRELRRGFRAQFGLRVPEYVQLVRASRAVALFGTPTKVEAIAWEVGYRSKKDLYASLKRWVGATPSELRALTNEERGFVEEGLRERMKTRIAPGAGF